MGNVHAKKGASEDPKKAFPNDVPKFILKEQVAKKGVLKAYLGEYDGTGVIVKVYQAGQEEDMQWVVERLSHLWTKLNPCMYPMLMPYSMWFQSRQPKSSACYLIRQQLMASLHDRMGTRPFLSSIEKRFLVYQLVRAVQVTAYTCIHTHPCIYVYIHAHTHTHIYIHMQFYFRSSSPFLILTSSSLTPASTPNTHPPQAFHLLDVVHGDLKPENVMVTSWNMLVVTDFSPFKPVLLPLNDPSSYNIFFNATERDICYVAPERFVEKGAVAAAAAAAAAGTSPPSSRPTTARLPKDVAQSFIQETNPNRYLALDPDLDPDLLTPTLTILGNHPS
jgi:serine/threonine protein kinase